MSEQIHIISLGAGVQSSTMALMAAAGEITPMPKCAIFADTQAEPKSVYTWLDWLEKQLPFPVHRVCYKGGLTKAIEIGIEKKGSLTGSPPWFTHNENGDVVPVSRNCTHDFKIHPIQMAIRKISECKRGQKNAAILWIGISMDEAYRMKDSRYPHYSNRWPMIEIGKSRRDCLKWMKLQGFPEPPKSSCVYCPYHSDHQWRAIKKSESDWTEAIRIDSLIRSGVRPNGKPPMFSHRSCKPLSEVDFSTEEERGQLNMFNNECEGMCGV